MSSGISLRESQQYCRRLARSHYENFLVASILLPRRHRQPFYNIYAFCRTADDLADLSPDPQSALLSLDELKTDLESLFAGDVPSKGFFPALADTVKRYQLGKQPFDDLLSAFRQDQRIRHYLHFEHLLDYCQRSANPVGHLVLSLGGALNETTAALSNEICTGLQLANLWQDVARDFAIDRIYLPDDLREQFGVTPEMLGLKETPPPLRELLAQLCDQTDGFFDRGLPLVNHVPGWLASDIKLFAHGGRETLNAIRRIDYDVLRIRPTVGKFTQFTLVLRAMMRLL